MFRNRLLAITLPAIALSASLPVFADTVTRYEIRSTTGGVAPILQPGVVEYRRFSSATAPNVIETRTVTNSVVAPSRPLFVPSVASSVRLIETPVVTPVPSRVLIENSAPVFLENRVISQPVIIRRAPAPVVMETYNPPVVVEKRYKLKHRSEHHLLDVGAPLIHMRAF
ncbi:MAG: hypothetical protein K2Y39_18605 [Candidatus Obscuribacterales bacterium]|nr:hypothetical protein [Candidatus Obscuribacterales bacterium]